jgi:hypothetical protein
MAKRTKSLATKRIYGLNIDQKLDGQMRKGDGVAEILVWPLLKII